jgi:hypothetical protein
VKTDSQSQRQPFSSTRSTRSTQLAIVPLALAVALMASNRWFTAVDDESAIIDRAARPVSDTVRLFLTGAGMHEHPPLYDLFLHAWLRLIYLPRLTGADIYLLRLPSVVFYVAGAWVLSLVAKRFGGMPSQFWTLAIVALSPFGFHFGRLATWYSCAFLLVSLVTWTYVRFLDEPSVANWIWFVVAALALVYANYFGWVFLGLIGVDYLIHNISPSGGRDVAHTARWLFLTAAVLLLAYLPIFGAFLRELHTGTRPRFIPIGLLFNIGYNIYLVFVSESVAPWFWAFSIASSVAIAACLLLLLQYRSPARRFFFYFLCVIACLTALGIIMSKRTFFMTPWLVLPLGVALGTMPRRLPRRVLLGALALCAAVGWYGIFSRSLYAAPHWLEPWDEVARESANTIRGGGIVIGNNPSFFFYLSYLLPVTPVAPHAGTFAGLLPASVRAANVYTPEQWIAVGQPTRKTVVMVEGEHYGSSADASDETEHWLDSHCALHGIEKKTRDPGAKFKQTYARLTQLEWRVQVRNYSCP